MDTHWITTSTWLATFLVGMCLGKFFSDFIENVWTQCKLENFGATLPSISLEITCK
jgi:hypothetical protein